MCNTCAFALSSCLGTAASCVLVAGFDSKSHRRLTRAALDRIYRYFNANAGVRLAANPCGADEIYEHDCSHL